MVQEERDEVVNQLQEELKEEIDEIDEEQKQISEDMDTIYSLRKQEMLEELNEQLKDAKNSGQFQDLLAAFQIKQTEVDKELEK